jgi:hypothetical protein
LTGQHEETTMTIDEASRLHLHEQARRALGAEAADILMTALPREPDRLVTKDDIAVLEANIRSEVSSAKADTIRTLMLGMVASNATLVGLAFAAARFS